MPHRRHRLKRLLARLLFVSLLGWAVAAMRRDHQRDTGPLVEEQLPTDSYGWEESIPESPEVEAERVRRRFGGHRMAASVTFAVLFFAGAAFSAGAGDLVTEAVESATETTAPAAPAEAPATDAPASEDEDCPERLREFEREECADDDEGADPAPPEAPAEGAPAPDPAAPAETPAAELEQPAATPVEASPDGAAEPEDFRPTRPVAPKAPDPALARARPHKQAKKPKAKPVLAPKPVLSRHASGHEKSDGTAPEFGTIWLDRNLPDPTPPARRLTPRFARNLKLASRQAGVPWADVLAVLRARGDRGQAPAGRRGLDALASRLAELDVKKDAWGAFLALEGRTAFADRALALSRYNRAVGLRALVRGLEWAKPRLVKKVLGDERISIYFGGREDIRSDTTDVRILVLLAYLAEAHGQVSVSSLTSGHGVFARPGVVSAHMYGLAVDIAALDGLSIAGNQQPGGITEDAVRNVLLLPSELRPMQVISLLGMGGPSFPMANHYDHIHVGY